MLIILNLIKYMRINNILQPSSIKDIYDLAVCELNFEKDIIIEYEKNNRDILLSNLYIDKERKILIDELTKFSRDKKIKKLLNKKYDNTDRINR